jgi:tetratricopeptide (TPR) repeat protein
MQKLVAVIILSVLSISSSAQSNFQQFKTLFKEKDTTRVKQLLKDWEKTTPTDPEFYTCAFNFYFSNSKHEIISLQQNSPKGESFELKDSTGKTVAYLGSDVAYDPNKLTIAFRYITTGIQQFPDRLDMRFGKCYALQQIGDYSNFTKTILETVEYSVVNKNKWLWTENNKADDAENILLGSIHTYLRDLYDTQNDSLLTNMIQIGNATLSHYPDNIEILSTTSVALLLTKDFDKAITYLKHAETLNPKDYIVLNNIAQGYKLKGDKANAIKYYELTAKYGDEQAKEEAGENIKQLKK